MGSLSEKEIINSQIELYLKRVASHLYGASPKAVNDSLEEIRQHLHASSEEFVRNGLSADQAVQSAILRFGSPDRIGASLARHLTVYGFPINVYRALWVCNYTRISGGVLGVLQLFGWNAWSAVIIFVSICIIAAAVQAPRRFMAQSKSGGSLSRRIARILRELQREHVERMVNLAGGRRRLYLFNMASVSIVSIHEHAYGLLGLFALSIVEFVIIRRTASRLGANVSA